VSNLPFGFTPPPGDDDSGNRPGDPFSALLGGGDPADLGAAFQRLGQLLSWQGGPVNWDLAKDIARQAVAGGSDPSPNAAQRAEVDEAARLAEHWLDGVTTLPAGSTGAAAWSRAEWVEATLPVWRQLCDPVAARVVDAMGSALPTEMAAMAGPLVGVMRQLGGAMFGAQLGQAVGSLAGEVLGSTDVGLPLGPSGRAALVPANVAAFGAGLGVPAEEVRLYVALRESAHHRLFAHVPWLRARLIGAVEDYARGITVDTSRIEAAMTSIDPTNPASLQEALQSGMFEPENSPAQQAALTRLETLLALVEGWVDEVVSAAAGPHLPAADALRETARRRRATGGPAEQTFASLVGLELRPRRLREAAALWHELGSARGQDGRDAIWSHPDLLPTADDLDDPAAFARRAGELDLSGLDATPAPDEPASSPRAEPPADPLGEGESPERPGG